MYIYQKYNTSMIDEMTRFWKKFHEIIFKRYTDVKLKYNKFNTNITQNVLQILCIEFDFITNQLLIQINFSKKGDFWVELKRFSFL